MVRDLVIKVEPAELAVGQIQVHFFAQPSLRADAVAVTHDQHTEHQFGIDRRSSDLAIETRQLLAQISQDPGHGRIDPAQ